MILILLASVLSISGPLPTIEVTDGAVMMQLHLDGDPNYVAVGVLSGASSNAKPGGMFDKVHLYRIYESGSKSDYKHAGTINLGFVNGLPAGIDMVAGDVDGDRKEELGISVRNNSSGTNSRIGLILCRGTTNGPSEFWRLMDGAPQLLDMDLDGEVEVGQFGSYSPKAANGEPIYYLEHIYRFRGMKMVRDNDASQKIFHTARLKAQDDMDKAIQGKKGKDAVFRAAAEMLLIGRKDKDGLKDVWDEYKKVLKQKTNGEQWKALKQLKP